MRLIRVLVSALIFGLFVAALSAQTISEAEFIDKPLRDILTALGQLGGKTIVVDDTVAGNATHYIKNKSFDDALKLILESNRLYAQVQGDVLIVSKIDASVDQNGLVSFRGEGVGVEMVLRRLARLTGRTILYEPLPPITLDLNLSAVTLDTALATILKRLPGYTIEHVDQSVFIKAPLTAGNAPGAAGANAANGFTITSRDDGNFDLVGRSVRVSDLLDKLFAAGKREFSMLKRSDSVIDRLNFSDKSFDQLLRLVLELSDGDFTVKDGIYYILDVNRNDILKKFDTVRSVQLRHLTVTQVLNLIPSSLLGGNVVKVDKSTNSLLLAGSDEELLPIVDFIKNVDRAPDGFAYYRFDFKYLPVDTVTGLLPENLKVADPIIVKAQNSMFLLLSPELVDQAKAFIGLLDQAKKPQVVALKYIRADDLIAKLPSFTSKDNISVGPDQRYVFFTGSPEQFRMLQDQMKYIDLPIPQIEYKVLIVQYQNNNDLSAGSNGLTVSNNSNAPSTASTDTATPIPLNLGGNLLTFSSTLGKASNFNFNLASAFGLNFAFGLQAQAVDHQASILADTTVNALSNQDVSFKNTNTTRVSQSVLDVDGKPTGTSVIREIVTGLVVGLKGWVSGDGMVTMTVSTSFSQQSAAPAGSTDQSGNASLPSTFEKVFSTSVRGPSGKSIVLGGLVETDSDDSTTKTPGLGDVPLVGELFKSRVTSKAKTELMIYIIPRVQNPMLFDAPLPDALMYLYEHNASSARDSGAD